MTKLIVILALTGLLASPLANACAKDGKADGGMTAAPAAPRQVSASNSNGQPSSFAANSGGGARGINAVTNPRQNVMNDGVFNSVGGSQTPYEQWSSDVTK